MATFGNDTGALWAYDNYGYMAANPATLTENGTVTKLTVRVRNIYTGHKACQIVGAIYDDDGAEGIPGTLLAQSAAVDISDSLADSLVDLTLTAPEELSAGDYWLVIAWDGDCIGLETCNQYSLNNGYFMAGGYTFPTMPSTFSSGGAWSDLYVLYGTYAADLPVLTTKTVTNIDTTTADSGGIITDDGGETLLAYGVCWNKTGSPTTEDDYTDDS